ncbi:hypothetical protein SAMN02745166_04855 [Prosthecobacter debontii]|uniref:Uncharacterized protein n=1 Tax=Prosthecobacter debontii TaxID=48467 RepID=A0A1T4Z1Y2_9BACT|nr:hypothetical protein SAMN02745166_04855 [Prosthecobacter debontii]
MGAQSIAMAVKNPSPSQARWSRRFHGPSSHTRPHGGQAFKGAIGINTGVLAVEGDVGRFIDFTPKPGR